jgi:hypothetical protein
MVDQACATALADMPPGFPGALFDSVKRGLEQRIPRRRAADEYQLDTSIKP